MLYLIPEWFFNFGILLEFLFFVLSGVVAYYSFKVYNVSHVEEVKMFGLAFSFISISYFIKGLVNYLLSEISSGNRIISLAGLYSLNSWGIFLFISLFSLGLICLTFITFKTNNYRLLSMMTIIGLLFVWLSNDLYLSFSILTSVLTAFIVFHYFHEFKEKKNKRTRLVLIAFLMLFLSSLGFIIPGTYFSNFVAGHLLELACYVLILIALIKVR